MTLLEKFTHLFTQKHVLRDSYMLGTMLGFGKFKDDSFLIITPS